MIELYDPSEEQIRRIRLALFKRFVSTGYSSTRGISVGDRYFAPGEKLDPLSAKKLAFQMGGRREGHPFLLPGTNEPTAESRERAKEKLATEDAAEKRQEYEKMLAIGRQSGYYRAVAEYDASGKLWFFIQPGNRRFASEDEALMALKLFNTHGHKP